MEYVLHGLWSAMELVYSWLFFSGFYEAKLRKGASLRFLAPAWLIMTVYSCVSIDPFSHLLVRVFAMVLMLVLMFRESGQKGLLLLAFSAVLALIVEAAALFTAAALLRTNITALTAMETPLAVATTLGKSVSIFSAWLLGRYKKGSQLSKNNKWLYLTMLLPTVLVFAVVIIFFVGNYQSGTAYISGAVLVCGVLLLSNLAIHFAIRAMERNTTQELDLRLQRQHMEMQTESIKALEHNYRLQRKSTHEFEHHLQVLRDLLEEKQVEQAKAYISRLQGSRSYRVISVNSHHPIIDVILNQKYQTALENGIKMQLRVNDLSQVTMPADSLVVILSNLLDNAIEACRRVDGYREIDCSVLFDEGLYIAIRNTSGPVRVVDGTIPTSKADKFNHGFGLNSIGELLDRLGGEYTFGWEDGWFSFAAEIE